MTERIQRASPFFKLTILIALALILWATFGLYQSVRKVDASGRKLRALRDEYFEVERFILGTLREQNEALNAAVETGDPAQKNRFDRCSQRWYTWLEQKKRLWITQLPSASGVDTPIYDAAVRRRSVPLLVELGSDLTNYIQAASFLLANARYPALQDTIAEKKQAVLKARARLWNRGLEAQMRGEALEVTLTAEKQVGNLQSLVRQLIFGVSLALIGVFFLLVTVIYRRRVARTAAILRQQQREQGEQQAKVRKLTHFGRLAQELAHEIKQPLTAINARMYTLQKLLPANAEAHKDAAVIRSEIKRLDRTLKDFLELARPAEPKLVPLTAEETLSEVCELMDSQLKLEGIEIACDSGPDVTLVADPQQLKQVLLNLVRNAAESFDNGQGKITLRARKTRAELQGARTDAALIEVCDNGPGISPEIKDRIFDPFFSTKGEGTGLGLAIAARIVDKHGGTLDFETKPGQGTTFRIVLPATLKATLNEQSAVNRG